MQHRADDTLADLTAEIVEASGGQTFRVAASLFGGLPTAVCPDSRASSRQNADLRELEAARLRQWAISYDLLHDGAEFERRWQEQGEMGGSENDIWYDETTGRVWKRNHIRVFCVSWRQFFDRIFLHNFMFPEAPLRFEGVLEHEGELCGVLSQSDIRADRGAVRNECERMMETRGFQRRAMDDYEGENLKVEDLHPGNVLVDSEGNLLVIDPAVFPR